MPKAHQPFPAPAAVHDGEADILARVIDNLADHDAKLVYADWLEERNDPRGPLLRDFVQAFRGGKKKLPSVKAAPKPWAALMGFRIIEEAHNTVLAPLTDDVLKIARPAIEYTTKEAPEKSIPVGASKFGGRPDLPPGTKWPEHEGEPLAFLGQFNLAELQASPVARDLPSAGLLSAFALYRGDGDDWFPDGAWRLLHTADVSKVARTALPEELEEEAQFPACRVEFAEALALPPDRAKEAEGLGLEDAHPADNVYCELYYSLCRGDHLLGYPFPIQGNEFRGKGERHLLSICGNEDTGWEFGDGGALYFIIGTKALAAGKFGGVKMFMDCS
jgi:uncharacterized protein (TIGR02996 family)